MSEFLSVGNTLVFGVLAITWTSKNWFNTALKVCLWGMFIGNLLWCLKLSGYIVKI